jgi:membrane fusion protein (multidrug efflux system)
VGCAVAVAFSGCGGESDGAPAGAPGNGAPGGAERAIPIAVARVTVGDAASYYTTTATLEAESRAEIAARTTGVVRQVLREEGDFVEAGDTLLLLEDDELRARVRQAEANLAKAQADHERRATMRATGLLSAQEFETSVNTLRVQEAEVELANLDLAHTRVSSPFAGRVVRRLIDLGANVSPGAPLFEVMDVNPLLARVHIPAKRMGFVRVGQDIELVLDSDKTELTGVVSLVSPIVDSSTGTVKVTAEIRDYPPATRPGDFAQVRIVTERHENSALVPSVAIFEDAGQSALYVVEDGKAARRVVVPGFVDGDFTEVMEGLDLEALVVTKGQRELRDGVGVEVLEGPADVLEQLAAEKSDDSAKADPEAGDGGGGSGRADSAPHAP